MAVIVRKKIIIDGKPIIMTPFLGKGKITKDDMEKAKKLDRYLEQKMSQIFKEMKKAKLFNINALRKWHALGKELSFVDDRSLVNAEDVNNGYIWLAIRQHCPTKLLPKGTKRTGVGATTERDEKEKNMTIYIIVINVENIVGRILVGWGTGLIG